MEQKNGITKIEIQLGKRKMSFTYDEFIKLKSIINNLNNYPYYVYQGNGTSITLANNDYNGITWVSNGELSLKAS